MPIGFASPRDFGAVMDGKSMDTAAMQLAMASDDPLWIDGPIRIDAPVVHSGANSKLVAGPSGETSRIILCDPAQDGIVSTGGGLVVEGIMVATGSAKTAGSAIKASGAARVVVRGCHISGEADKPHFNGVEIDGLIPTVAGNYFLNCSAAAIRLGNTRYPGAGSEASVVDNWFNTNDADNRATAVLWTSGDGPMLVRGNRIQNHAYGLRAPLGSQTVAADLHFTANMVANARVAAVELSRPFGSTAQMASVLMSDNVLRQGAGGKALVVERASGPTPWVHVTKFSGNICELNEAGFVTLKDGVVGSVTDNVWRGATDVVPVHVDKSEPMSGRISKSTNLTQGISSLFQFSGNQGWSFE